TIANVETGRQNVPRDFWERADQAVNAGGALLAAADQLEALVQRQREETAQLADIKREREQHRPGLRQVAELASSPEQVGVLLDHLRDQWHLLVKTDNLLGPRHAARGVLDQLAVLEELLRVTRDATRREVARLAARYAESAAWLHEDAGDLPRARFWTSRAMEWAHEVQDPFMPARPKSASRAQIHAEVAVLDLPTWFGMRLAYLIGVVDSWPGPGVQSEALQALLQQEFQMYDSIVPKDQQRLAYAQARRQTLITLAALPLSPTYDESSLSP